MDLKHIVAEMYWLRILRFICTCSMALPKRSSLVSTAGGGAAFFSFFSFFGLAACSGAAARAAAGSASPDGAATEAGLSAASVRNERFMRE